MKRNGTETVKLDAVYPQTQERVWRALTDSRELAKWMMPNDFEPTVGHKFTFNSPNGDKIRCQVTSIEDGRLLAYTWQRPRDETAAVVTWTLEPVEAGTRVRITHSGLAASAFTACGLSTALRRSLAPSTLTRVRVPARIDIRRCALLIKPLSGQKPATRRILR